MAGSIAARQCRVAYIAEVTPGVTPATPTFKVFRATGESLEVQRTLSYTSELNGKRGRNAHSLSSKAGAGGLDFKWSNITLEDFLESALRNTWSTNVLIDGTAQKSFTLECTYEGGASDVYKRLTGAEVNTMSLALRAGEDITGTVNFLALDGDFAQTAIASSTYTAANTNAILNYADFGALAMSGLTVGCVSSLDLTINNNLQPVRCLGTLGATDIDGSATLEVTGSMSILLTGAEYDILRAGADATSTSLTFEVGRTAGQKVRFELPNIVLNDINPKAEDADAGTILLTPTFTAMQASTLSNGVIRVTRAI